VLRNGYECCDECGKRLRHSLGATLDDELLCPACYKRKSRSLRWILVNVITNSVVFGGCLFLVLNMFTLSALSVLKVILLPFAAVALIMARPRILAVVKDIFMKRHAYDERLAGRRLHTSRR
jgi:hypothetical protein